MGALYSGVKWLGHEADHSRPSSTKLKIARSYNSISMILLRDMHRYNFNFYLNESSAPLTAFRRNSICHL